MPGCTCRLFVSMVMLAGLSMWVGCGAEHGPPAESSWKSPPLPDSAIGQVVQEYVEAFNSGDAQQLDQFLRTHLSEIGPGGAGIEGRIRSQQSLYNSSRGMDVYEAHQPDDSTISLIAKYRLTEEWRKIDFIFEAPHGGSSSRAGKITGIRIVPTDPPKQIDKQIAVDEALTVYIDRLAAADQFSGVVLISRAGQLPLSLCRGIANRTEKIPITIDTPFHYASLGKMFTAVAIGQLVQEDRLSFEDSLATLLPDCGIPAAESITVDQLLSHRSGIQDFFELSEFEEVRTSLQPDTDYLSLIRDLPLRFPPGAKFEYSNSNFLLLGAIVERLSGESFEQYLKDHIFGPAGMTSTSLAASPEWPVAPAVGYTELTPDGQMTPGVRRSSEFIATTRGTAAGGGVTTAMDLLRFSQSLQSEQLVSREILEQLLQPRTVGARPNEKYAYGFMSREHQDERIVGHSGGYPGADAQFDLYLKSGWTVIVLCNYEGVGETVARYIEKKKASGLFSE